MREHNYFGEYNTYFNAYLKYHLYEGVVIRPNQCDIYASFVNPCSEVYIKEKSINPSDDGLFLKTSKFEL